MATERFQPPADLANTNNTFVFWPNYAEGFSYLVLGLGGTVRLTYEHANPEVGAAYIVTPGQRRRDLQPGTNDYKVNDGDWIIIMGLDGAGAQVQFSYI